MGELVIRNEADAWGLLKDVCEDNIADILSIKFESWPILSIKLEGPAFNANISTKMMEAFVELQKNINTTYSKLLFDEANVRHLTDEDKKNIEILVQVAPGSSEYKIDLQQIMERFVQGVTDKMTGKHVVIIALAGGLMWAGQSSWKSYLQNQKEIKNIEMQKIAGEQETKRMEILANATRQQPYLISTKVDTDEIYNKILKASSSATGVNLPGVKIKGEEAKQLTRGTRSPSTEVRLDGTYRILKVDSSKPDYFKVELQEESGKRFPAILQDATINKESNKQLLQEAEWSKKPISLAINGTEVRGNVTTAYILDVMDRYKK